MNTEHFILTLSGLIFLAGFTAIAYRLLIQTPGVYFIKKGRHRSGYFFKPFFKKRLVITGMFNPSCWQESDHWNKLGGFSQGRHHRNSARVAWRFKNGQYELAAYCYIEGRRIIKRLGTIRDHEDFVISITDAEQEWFFDISTYYYGIFTTAPVIKHVTIPKKSAPGWGYLLFPYFGGKTTAQKDLSICLKYKG